MLMCYVIKIIHCCVRDQNVPTLYFYCLCIYLFYIFIFLLSFLQFFFDFFYFVNLFIVAFYFLSVETFWRKCSSHFCCVLIGAFCGDYLLCTVQSNVLHQCRNKMFSRAWSLSHWLVLGVSASQRLWRLMPRGQTARFQPCLCLWSVRRQRYLNQRI